MSCKNCKCKDCEADREAGAKGCPLCKGSGKILDGLGAYPCICVRYRQG